jgi:hypothetical protein
VPQALRGFVDRRRTSFCPERGGPIREHSL